MKTVKNKYFWLVIGPSMALIALAVVLPELAAFLVGGATAWALAATAIFGNHERMEYEAAIRHKRRGEFAQAISTINKLINIEPASLKYHRFRADLYWLSGDLQQAIADYEWMIGRDPDLADGYIRMAGIEMNRNNYDKAREYALAALERDKGWMAAYDLGLIEDRQRNPESAVKYLEAAFATGIPYSHHRFLAGLWLARNMHRLGHDQDAQRQLDLVRKETKGLRDWQAIFKSEQGVVLRDMFEEDVHLAQQLLKADMTLEALD